MQSGGLGWQSAPGLLMMDRERSGTCFLEMASIRGTRRVNIHCLRSMHREAATLLCALGAAGRPIVTRQFPDSGDQPEEIEVLMQGSCCEMSTGA